MGAARNYSCTIPKWSVPATWRYPGLVNTKKRCKLLSDTTQIVPTAGHRFGHRSILITDKDIDLLKAGDVTFSGNETQSDFFKNTFAGYFGFLISQ